jgi:magnesium-transporting ATPase (P-type)
MEDQNKTEELFSLSLDSEGRSLLKTTTVWAKIVAIVAFVEAGVSLVTSVIGKSNPAGVAGAIFASLIGVLISVLLNIFLYRFAQKTGEALNSSNQQSLIEGINSLRNYFKVLGILIIIGVSLFLIAMIFVFISMGLSR